MINKLLALASGISSITHQCLKHCNEKTLNIIEDNILKGNYVKREEFEILKSQFESLKKDQSSK